MKVYFQAQLANAYFDPELVDIGLAPDQGELLHIRLPEVRREWSSDPTLGGKVVMKGAAFRVIPGDDAARASRQRKVGHQLGEYLDRLLDRHGELEPLQERAEQLDLSCPP